ncbi:MAG: hypothetical protein HUU14_05900 [Dehalococcoidia bacterium]|nr:hypothetical protein [Chloroflexi bacterium CFX7]MCK6564024.1 hypothetical protein [Dehalococcoidia bacterium]NUQ55398.1 hypothetical protein [Dehalococcoidia bacterium]RIL01696.1 MAG: hypothetical protein DCC78_09680 [bacterium]
MKSRIILLALALPLALSVLLVACGGDDDDDGGGSDSGSSANIKTGSDEDYVGDMCKAFDAYAAGLTKAMLSMGTSDSPDIEKMMKALVEPMEDFAGALAKMKPPADMKDWHVASIKSINDAVKTLKDSKDLESLDAIEDLGNFDMAEMPAGAEERLGKLAAKNKDCQKADLFGGE